MAGFLLARFWLLRECEPEGGKAPFLGYKLEWDAPDQTPKGLCLLPLAPHPPDRARALKPPVVGAVIGGGRLRRGRLEMVTPHRRGGDEVTFQISSRPKGPPSFGCPSPVLAAPALGRLWFHAEGTRHDGSKATHFLVHPPQHPAFHDSPALGPKSAQAPGM